MKKFVIVTDSCSDLSKSLRTEYDIDYIPMHLIVDGKEYKADLDWGDFSVEEYYKLVADGAKITTAQNNKQDYLTAFTDYLENGYDILSISCSAALSASIHSSEQAREELLQKYPDSKIYCIDSLNAGMGLGLLCITASEMRKAGKTIEEAYQFVLDNRLNVHQECTVESLTYLKRAGRVSSMTAFFGGLLNVKPIIISDVNGMNASIEKVKGRKASFDRIVERFKDEYRSVPHQKLFLLHANCIDDANELKTAIEKACPDNLTVELGYLGPIVGASGGPGTVALYFFGKEVTYNSQATE